MNLLKIIISFLPISKKVRGKIYSVFGEVDRNFSIGFGSYIDSNSIVINESCCIGNLVRIKLLDTFVMGYNSTIGSNTVICGAKESNKVKKRSFKIGENTNILCSHYFDVVAPIELGNKVTIAGKWSQFYTHSFDIFGNRIDGRISLGNNIYIGAGCIINLGVKICDQVVLQSGTIVNHSINESGVYTSNHFSKRGEVRDFTQSNIYEKFKLENGKVVLVKE
jgi:acetyltransferase-like isoleucine patch superfamily enzyme